MTQDNRNRRWTLCGVGTLAVAMIYLFAPVHIDDVDANLYEIVARNLGEDRGWFRLRGLSAVLPEFYEHPPFFFWFLTGTMRQLGEAALPWVCGLFGIGTLILTYILGRHLFDWRVGAAAVVVLSLTESFFRYQARARLDGPLTMFFTLAVVLMVVDQHRSRGWVYGGLAAGVAVLIKGPPGLAAPIAGILMVGAWRGMQALAPQRLVLCLAVTCLFPLSFLAYDHVAGDGQWLVQYGGNQVLASTVGARADGHTESFYLLKKIATRFWPGFPFVLAALLSLRDGRYRGLLAWAMLIPAGYGIGGRAFWHYNMPAFVPLALLAGASAVTLATRLGIPSGMVAKASIAFGITALALVPTGLAARLQAPCPLEGIHERVVSGPGIGLIVAGDPYATAIVLGHHTRRDIVLGPNAEFLVAQRRVWPVQGYEKVESRGVWVIARRVGEAPSDELPKAAGHAPLRALQPNQAGRAPTGAHGILRDNPKRTSETP